MIVIGEYHCGWEEYGFDRAVPVVHKMGTKRRLFGLLPPTLEVVSDWCAFMQSRPLDLILAYGERELTDWFKEAITAFETEQETNRLTYVNTLEARKHEV